MLLRTSKAPFVSCCCTTVEKLLDPRLSRLGDGGGSHGDWVRCWGGAVFGSWFGPVPFILIG